MELNKRGMILIVFFVLILLIILSSFEALAQDLPPEPTSFFGDANGDGFISKIDYNIINSKINGINYPCYFSQNCLTLDFDNDQTVGELDRTDLLTILNNNPYTYKKPINITVMSNISNIIYLQVNGSSTLGIENRPMAGIAVIPETGELSSGVINVSYNANYNITNDSGGVSFVYTIHQYNQQQVLNFTILNYTLKVMDSNGVVTKITQFTGYNTTFNFSKLAPVFVNISNVTLEPNITIMYYWQNFTFNCSMSFEGTESRYFNISWFWFEESNVLISNTSFNADYRMSNHTNVINGTYWAPTNLTNGSDAKNYKYGYNYSCGACIYNGSNLDANNIMKCANSSNVTIDGNIKVTMLPYLGNPRAFSVGMDKFLYGVNKNDTWGNYRENYDGLKDILRIYDSSNGTKFSLAVIPRPELGLKFNNASNITNPADNFQYILADLEYDKYVYTYLYGERYNTTAGIEYVGDTSVSNKNNLSYAANITQAAFNLYKNVIGRNATAFKFPDYDRGAYGSDVISGDVNLSNFPYKIELSNTLPLNNIQKDANDTVVIGEYSLIADPAPSFGGNYFVSAQNCPNSSMVNCINNASYKTELLTTMNYAEAEGNISYLDYGELGEIYSMYTYTNLELINDTMFQLITTSNWTYKKRLALNITGIFDALHQFANITTPTGLRIAQNMTKYTGSNSDRAALVILPVENGNYSIIPVDVQSPDPYFIVENVTVYANNTKWSFNGTNDSDGSAYMVFRLNWTGSANVWGDYNNTDNNFNFTHGFRFNHTKGDNWWVEHDMKSGKLHILGNSSRGIEYITAQLPFTFARTINNDNNKKYVINTTNMFKNITGSFNLSIPETYDSSWSLTVRYANGTNLTNVPFYRSSSIIFNIPGIQEDTGITIEYTAPPGPPGGGCSNCGGEEPSPEPHPEEEDNEDIIIITEDDIITIEMPDAVIKLMLDDVGLLKKKPRISIEFKIPEALGMPRLFKLFNFSNLISLLALLMFILFVYSNYKFVKLR